MTNTILKAKVIGKIEQISDNDILAEVSRILDISSTDEELFITSLNHKAAISEAISQIESRNYLKEEQTNYETEQWLRN
jgi:hypothetical protein